MLGRKKDQDRKVFRDIEELVWHMSRHEHHGSGANRLFLVTDPDLGPARHDIIYLILVMWRLSIDGARRQGVAAETEATCVDELVVIDTGFGLVPDHVR
jgi:hypothetical protein